MPKSDNQKLKIFYILEYLQKNSHADHPVRATELIEMLERHDIRCERKTVYSDIAALQDYGIDIVSTPGKNGGYYIASRNFELPELKLLIDAVQSSRFLTEKKSRELIEGVQCSRSKAGPPGCAGFRSGQEHERDHLLQRGCHSGSHRPECSDYLPVL